MYALVLGIITPDQKILDTFSPGLENSGCFKHCHCTQTSSRIYMHACVHFMYNMYYRYIPRERERERERSMSWF